MDDTRLGLIQDRFEYELQVSLDSMNHLAWINVVQLGGIEEGAINRYYTDIFLGTR